MYLSLPERGCATFHIYALLYDIRIIRKLTGICDIIRPDRCKDGSDNNLDSLSSLNDYWKTWHSKREVFCVANDLAT